MAFGRNGERVAKTPTRSLPPRRGGRTVGRLGHEGLEQRLAVLGQLHHARQHVDVLVGLAGGAAALAIHLEDEQLRVHLHENAFALDDFRPTHIGPNFQALTYEVV